MEFEYTYRMRNDGSVGVGRPIIWIDLESPTLGTFSYPCLVDSGADDCTFDAEIGETIGLDIKSGDRDEASGIKKDASLLRMEDFTFIGSGRSSGKGAGTISERHDEEFAEGIL